MLRLDLVMNVVWVDAWLFIRRLLRGRVLLRHPLKPRLHLEIENVEVLKIVYLRRLQDAVLRHILGLVHLLSRLRWRDHHAHIPVWRHKLLLEARLHAISSHFWRNLLHLIADVMNWLLV